MNRAVTKAYCKRRFVELTKNHPEWTRVDVTNFIIAELKNDFGIRLTMPSGHNIVRLEETLEGTTFHVDNLVEVRQQ